MKLHILNDLHIEFEDFEPPATDADVVVLAGDIGVGLEGLHWAKSRFPDRSVIYVPGNHELYYHDIAMIDEMKAQSPKHIHVLNDDQVVIEGVRFLGGILWTATGRYSGYSAICMSLLTMVFMVHGWSAIPVGMPRRR